MSAPGALDSDSNQSLNSLIIQNLLTPTRIGKLLKYLPMSGHYTPSQGTVIGALYRNLGVSIKQMAMECEYDLRNAFSIWISSPMSGFKFKRILCVEIIGSQFQLADVLENLFVGMAILEAKGVEISSLALPILGAGRERLDPKTVMRILLPAAQRALERSLHLSRILFVELKPEHVATLRDT